MIPSLPEHASDCLDWPWARYEPHYQALNARPISAETVETWLQDWTRLGSLVYEVYQRLYVAITVNTTDSESERLYKAFVDSVFPSAEAADQLLKEKLLASGLEPAGFEIPLRNLQAEAAIFRAENLPLRSEEFKLSADYDRIIGAQSVTWEDQELTLMQLLPIYQEPDRAKRERAWRLAAQRQLDDRQAINDLWVKLLALRRQMAENAGLPDYRAYRWQQMLRFDYTPEDCRRFHRSIEQAAIPAAQRIYARRRARLGLDSLRPWDLDVDPTGLPALRPFETIEQLENGVGAIFKHVDPQLAGYFETMRREGLLDLDNRKGKAPGGYCTDYPLAQRPFIFMNSVGIHDDVQTLLHEGGHAFHVFETNDLPYLQQKQVGLEFAEVASTSMELLGAPYLTHEFGGFYTPAEAARATIQFLEATITFWPYLAVVDAFQHWVYENPAAASNPVNCDQQWAELWERFMVGVDWSELDDWRVTGWQRKLHIIQSPFYYIEYGLAQLGALQVWANARRDQAGAVAAYRRALSLGGTRPLPELYAAAGAKLAFDVETMQALIDLSEEVISELEELVG